MFRVEKIDETSINYREKLKIFNICLLLDVNSMGQLVSDVRMRQANILFEFWCMRYFDIHWWNSPTIKTCIFNSQNPPHVFCGAYLKEIMKQLQSFQTTPTLTPLYNLPWITKTSLPNTPKPLIFFNKCYRIDINSSASETLFFLSRKSHNMK